MFKNNIRKIADVKRVPLQRLSQILGPGTALKVKHELGLLKERKKPLETKTTQEKLY